MKDELEARKIFGIENEMGTTGDVSIDIPKRISLNQALDGLRSNHTFLTNGARVYRDHGSHIEYATPECQSIRDVVACDVAGQEILTLLTEQTDEQTDEQQEQTWLNLRNVDDKGNTWGSHENYLVPRSANPESRELSVLLASHLATRSLFTGAGFLESCGNDQYDYRIAQKASGLRTLIDLSTTLPERKPMVNLRDEPLSDASKYRRLHITAGDATISPWATAMRIGTTSLVVDMYLAGVNLRPYIVADPVAANATVYRDLAFTRKVERNLGGMFLPIDVQSGLAHQALKFVSRDDVDATEEEKIIAEEWCVAVSDFKQNPLLLRDRTDWVAKWKIITHADEKPFYEGKVKKIYNIDILWGELSANGLGRTLRNRIFRDPLNSMAYVEHYMIEPPEGRASIRSDVIRQLSLNDGDQTVFVDWDAVIAYDRDLEKEETVTLLDPFGRDVDEQLRLKQFLDRRLSKT